MSETDLAVDDAILEEFVCPVCRYYILPPIFECLLGHAICSHCSKRVNECPLCRAEIAYSKNHTLEKLQEKLKFPCLYKDNGCDVVDKSDVLKSHVKKCKFKPKKANTHMIDKTALMVMVSFRNIIMIGMPPIVFLIFEAYIRLFPQSIGDGSG